MEYDRYKANRQLFILGLISLIISIVLIVFSLYIMPYLIWKWVYNIPEFVLHWREWLEYRQGYTNNTASWIIFLVFFIPGLMTAVLAYYSSNKVENDIYGIEPEVEASELASPQKKQRDYASFLFGLKIFLIILIVFFMTMVFEWVLKIDEPPI